MQSSKKKQDKHRVKPSHRDKTRYIAYRLHGSSAGTNAVIAALEPIIGSLGLGEAGISIVPGKKDIIRVSARSTDKVKACLGLISNINDKPVSIELTGTSGMLNKA